MQTRARPGIITARGFPVQAGPAGEGHAGRRRVDESETGTASQPKP